MSALESFVEYQDLACLGGFYRRSQGFEPDRGWVDIDCEIMKAIHVEPDEFEWRPAGGLEMGGQCSFIAVHKLFRPTVSIDSYLPPRKRPAHGLARFGNLVFRTYDGGRLVHEEKYQDIYVDKTGIKDIDDDLGAKRLHKFGKIRVPVTDIKIYYQTRSSFYGRVNCRLQTGAPDLDTCNPETGKPWVIAAGLPILFALLPGSPILHPKGEWADGDVVKKESMPEIRGRGEPVVQILQDLLDDLGLKPQMLLNNHYTLSRKHSDRVPYGKYPSDVGTLVKLEDEIAGEGKTTWLTDRPSFMVANGENVVQRNVHSYIPAFQWLDGRYYKLEDVGKLIKGYTLEKVNRQTLASDDKRFRDLPKVINYRLMEDILRTHAYRTYAPASVFDLPIARDVGTGAVSVSEEDLQRFPYLPFVDCPMYKKELSHPKFARRVPLSSAAAKADQDDIVFRSSVVWASQVGPGAFSDFAEFKEIWEATQANDREWVVHLKELLANVENRLKDLGKILQIASRSAAEAVKDKSYFQKFGEFLLSQPGSKKVYGVTVNTAYELDKDLLAGLAAVGVHFVDGKLIEERMTSFTPMQIVKASALAKEAARIREMIVQAEQALKEAEAQFAKNEATYKEYGYVDAEYMNFPHGVVSERKYKLDPKTGILTFDDPACRMHLPMVLDGDMGWIAHDGQVMVLAASEYSPNVTGRVTSALFMASGGKAAGEAVDVSCVGLCRSSPLKAKSVRIPGVRLFIDEFGVCMNAGAVISAGMAKCFGQMAQPLTVDGFDYKLDGCRRAVLDGGVEWVEHLVNEDGDGWTQISVNDPAQPSMIGVPIFKPRMTTVDYRQRLAFDREGVE